MRRGLECAYAPKASECDQRGRRLDGDRAVRTCTRTGATFRAITGAGQTGGIAKVEATVRALVNTSAAPAAGIEIERRLRHGQILSFR
jgi:hypothetical protein